MRTLSILRSAYRPCEDSPQAVRQPNAHWILEDGEAVAQGLGQASTLQTLHLALLLLLTVCLGHPAHLNSQPHTQPVLQQRTEQQKTTLALAAQLHLEINTIENLCCVCERALPRRSVRASIDLR